MSLAQHLVTYGEERLSHFFSLRGAEEQPTLEFWKANLVKFCLENQKLHFSVDEIMSAFTVDDLVPGFFDKSATELLKNKSLFDKEEISKSDDTDLIAYLMSSLWSSVFDNTINVSNKKLISGEILKHLENSLSKYAISFPSKELAFSRRLIPDFAHSFQYFLEKAVQQMQDTTERQLWTSWVKHLSQDDMDIIISHLVKQKLIKVDDKVVNVLVKSKEDNDIQTATAYLDIRITLHDISRKVNGLQGKIHQHIQNAIKAKSRSDTSSALMFLKLKKNSETSLQRILQAQYNLEECLQTMEGNEINKIVVEAYSSASKALKSVRQESGVTIDSVESAMEMFQDEMDQMQEIGDAIVSSPVASISDEERDALQEELDAILREENPSPIVANSQESIPSSVLPSAPTTNISFLEPKIDKDLMKIEKLAVIN